ELSKRVAALAEARAVVLAHHGLVTWGDTHEESYGVTVELVARARAFLERRGAELAGACDQPWSEVDERLLARLRGRLSSERRQVLAVAPGQRLLADRADVDAIAALRSTPDHMLRIGRRTA